MSEVPVVPNKAAIHDFWNEAACGELLLMQGKSLKDQFRHQAKLRYEWEPEILDFVGFERYRGKRVLEIGVGLGADHQRWAEAGAEVFGIDLTERAIELTRARFECFGLNSNLRVGDAENLPFEDNSFDVVYSWGVLLYCPDLPQAIAEIRRVVKPGGEAVLMLYHKYSLVGYMLWVRYALLRMKPFTPLREIYHRFLESEGTQAFTKQEVRAMMAGFSSVGISVNLCHGDLLTSGAGQRHEGGMLRLARRVWPRRFIRRFLSDHGLFMKIRAVK
jgi:ubiquinone/menaquinone biosynthesis C-methylase UbiE